MTVTILEVENIISCTKVFSLYNNRTAHMLVTGYNIDRLQRVLTIFEFHLSGTKYFYEVNVPYGNIFLNVSITRFPPACLRNIFSN